MAIFTKLLVALDDPSGTFDLKIITEFRQMDAKLGYTPKAMQELRWEIEPEPRQKPAEPEPAAAPAEPAPRVFIPRGPS